MSISKKLFMYFSSLLKIISSFFEKKIQYEKDYKVLIYPFLNFYIFLNHHFLILLNQYIYYFSISDSNLLFIKNVMKVISRIFFNNKIIFFSFLPIFLK